ncbi:hypothetical protein FOVG_15429 [Fusarium oxysporum f. sp. pisi HDV247]|uniref:Uncharacterized protein n=1 Tax=Fusarium oxysporum f. sp. pisi HDV247 TaxID=1080344 RepID=W9NKX4_FUSOX|nr:hypothetical protein FOVG_15429 [Fusarium oxysporum f. sp. pisi HDV247]
MAPTTSDQISAQWIEPGDIFSVLLIVGGDVVQLALAALTGNYLTPVAFSFGWVACAISAVVAALGENRLVRCPPEVSLKVINLRSGYDRPNQSWLLGRLVKTYDFWMPPEVKARLRDTCVLPSDEEQGCAVASVSSSSSSSSAGNSVLDPCVAPIGLCVAVYKWVDGVEPGVPARDWAWWSGFVASALQLGCSVVPWGRHGNWAIFVATAVGTVLAYISASLPQWRREKWHARRARKDVALTLGNGSQHVIVILGSDNGLDLEALASGKTPNTRATRVFTSIMVVLWLALLITCTGIKTDTWYLLAVGGLGMIHNLVVAGIPRHPAALGLPIELVKVTTGAGSPGGQRESLGIFARKKVMWTLMELEGQHKGYGEVLKDEFFPGKLRHWEEQWWSSKDPVRRRQLLEKAQKEDLDKSSCKQRHGRHPSVFPPTRTDMG